MFSRFLKCFASLKTDESSTPNKTQPTSSSSSSTLPSATASVRSEPPPIEVVSEILIRLPVTDLLRYKIVSKAWYDLITSPYFIKLHLNRTLINSNSGPKTRSDPATSSDQLLILSGPTSLQIVTFQTLIRSLRLDLPDGFTAHDSAATLLVGSCHGLICLCGNRKWDFAIYNPSTRANRVIAPAPVAHTLSLNVSFGFGYDGIGDDFKIVRIENYIRREKSLQVYTRDVTLYSMRSNSWKMVVEGESPDDDIDSRGVLVNDRLHWVAIQRGDERKGRIVSFDLKEEKFGEVPIPPHYGDMVHYPKDVATVGGKLCFLTEANSRGWLQYIDVWIMDQYGVGETWYMLYSLWCLQYPSPVAFLKGEDLVMVNEAGNVFWYDRGGHRKVDARISAADDFVEAALCLPTLVPVHY